MKKNILLALIASVSLTPVAFAWAPFLGPSLPPEMPVKDDTKPYVLKDGLNTKLIEGQPSIAEYFAAREHEESPSSPLDEVEVFFTNGSRVAFKGNLHWYSQQDQDERDFIMKRMADRNAVVCPCVELQSSSGKMVKYPRSIVFRTQELEICKLVEALRKKEQAK